ncbi:MAG: NAD(P)/FAD-dependent oxidoreductase [Rhodospirillales bacterium]
MTGGRGCDAVIVGAGIIGAAVALELARRGWRTVNLDRLPAAGYGSTGNSCAIVRFHYSTFEGAALAWEGHGCWTRWGDHLGVADERGLARFHECGCLIVKTEGNGFLRRVVQLMDGLGIPHREWDAAAMRAAYPFYDTRRFAPVRRPDDPGFGEGEGGEIAGAVFFPNAGYVNDPQLAAHNLQRAAEAAGARFRFNAEVAAIRKDGGGRIAGVVLADGEAIAAPVVVNAAGPHAAKVNALAGADADMTIGTRALRQEIAHVAAPAGGALPFFASDGDVGVYARPEIGGHLLVGSEDPPCDRRQWVDPDAFDRNLTDQARTQVLRLAQRIPALGIPDSLRGVVDLYDVSDDWLPIYDRSAVPGFYMAVGTSGHQFKTAPVVGALMAELIVRCEAGQDHDAEPVRFHLARTHRTLDLGVFSRRRPVNAESSFSVLG